MHNALPLVLLSLAACKHDKDTTPADSGEIQFPQWCDAPIAESATAATLGYLEGGVTPTYRYTGDAGTLYSQKFIPQDPFHLKTIRLHLLGDTGTARIRLTQAWGRSYPDFDNTVGPDLMDPIDISVEMTASDLYYDIDVSDRGIFLEPTQHYVATFEYQGTLNLGLETIADGDWSHALLFYYPDMVNAYGIDGNFQIQLAGDTFCAWTADEKLFTEDTTQPWQDVSSARVAVSDIDGDGHDDVIVNDGNPRLYLGDGKGAFAEDLDPWPDAAGSSMLVFGDIDNDGDRDAFAAWYIGWDSDGDHTYIDEGDCNDVDAEIEAGGDEVLGDYKDNDCDGIADDGTDTEDHDGDGVSIAAGDCNDADATVSPGATEVLNGKDDNCDLLPDDGFSNRLFLNDGTGHFTRRDDAGVETREPTTAAGWSDPNHDGFLDIYWGNWLIQYPNDPAVPDQYRTGNGDGTFNDATEAAGLVLPKAYSCYGVEWADWNNDGWDDLFVGNYHLYPNQLWKNLGDGTFLDVAEEVGVAFDDIPSPYMGYEGGHTYGEDFGDVDNDGDMDMYITNLAHPRTQPWGDPSMFVINQGAPDYLMVNVRDEWGLVYDEGDVNAAFADFDNDMDVDLAIASLYTDHYTRLYRNDGDHFTDVTYETGTAIEDAVSVTWSDVDEDGDMDLLYADRHLTPMVHLFTNKLGNENKWIELDLVGTTVNRDAIGARVHLTAGGVSQMRDVAGGQGQSNVQESHTVHFGLAQVDAVDSVSVDWQGGASEAISGLQPNHRYRVVQGAGTGEMVF